MSSSSLNTWFMQAPQWQIAVLVLGGMLAAWLPGALLHRRLRRRNVSDGDGDGEKETAQEGYVVTAVLGLLALLMGFTFALAIDRYDARRISVLTEANAIGTTYLRAQLLDEPHRSQISGLLRTYVDTRIHLAAARPQSEEQLHLLQRNDRLVFDLWRATVNAYPTIKDYGLSISFLQTMNEVIDLDTTRKVSRMAHVPPEVLVVLLLYLFTCAGVLGFFMVGKRGRASAFILFGLFGVALLLIIDIDRPAGGRIREPQGAMLMLRDFIQAHPPASFGSDAKPNP